MRNFIVSNRSLLYLSKHLCFYTICLTVSFTWFQLFPLKNISNSQLNFFVCRPLLKYSRLDCQKITFFLKIPLFVDKTNSSLTILRNRTRKQILPFFRFCYNRQIDKVLLQFSDLLVVEHFFFDSLVEKFFNQKRNIFFLQSLPLAVQRKVVYRLLANKDTNKTYFVVVEALTNLFVYTSKKKHFFNKIDTIKVSIAWFVFCPGNGSFLLIKRLKKKIF